MNQVYVVGAVLACIIYIGIGIVSSLKVKSVEDYYVSGRSASTLFLVASLVASYLSTIVFMGDAGFAYDGYVVPLLIMSLFVLPGYVIGVLFFGRYLRRSEALTLPDYFGKRFNSRAVQRMSAVTLIVGIISYLVAITQGASLLLAEIMPDLSYQNALIIVVLIYTSITFLSGAKGVLWVDTVMFLIFTAATFLALPYIIKAAGGFTEAMMKIQTLPEKPNILSWHGVTGENNYLGKPLHIFFFTAIIGFVWGSVLAVSPWQAKSYLMAKSEHVAIRAAILSTIVIAVMYLVVHFTMTIVNAIDPSINPSERVFISSVVKYVPQAIGVVAISGIFAATLATGSAFLQLIANSISNDLLDEERIGRKNLLLVSRLTVIGVALVGYFITKYLPPSMFWISIFAGTVFAASWAPIAFASVLSDKVTKAAAFWSIFAGFFVVLVTEIVVNQQGFEFPIYLNSALFGGLCSVIVLLIVTKRTKPTEVERLYYQKLMILPKEERDAKELARTMKYPTILVIAGLIVVALTYLYYYRPLQAYRSLERAMEYQVTPLEEGLYLEGPRQE